MRFEVLRAFYAQMVDNIALDGVSEASGIGHETLRQVKMTEAEWREFRGEKARPYRPNNATLLDLEAFYWDHQALLLLREDPDAPLPLNPLRALMAILPNDPAEAERAIQGIEQALRAADPPPVKPERLGELLRMMYRQAQDSTIQYPTTRKRARRNAKRPPDEPGDEKKGG